MKINLHSSVLLLQSTIPSCLLWNGQKVSIPTTQFLVAYFRLSCYQKYSRTTFLVIRLPRTSRAIGGDLVYFLSLLLRSIGISYGNVIHIYCTLSKHSIMPSIGLMETGCSDYLCQNCCFQSRRKNFSQLLTCSKFPAET